MFGLGGAKEALTQLTKSVAELYRELITTTVKFEEVRKYTKEAIDEFKRLIERQSDKVDRIERDRIKAEAELMAKISGLEARLNALSEGALHVAAGVEAAKYIARTQPEGVGPETKRITTGRDRSE